MNGSGGGYVNGSGGGYVEGMFIVHCETCGRLIGPFATQLSARAHVKASGHAARVVEESDAFDRSQLVPASRHVLP